jgi:hypothetical protein
MNYTKECKKCKEVKSLTEFNKQKDTKDGHKNLCKECQRKYNSQRYSTPEIKAKITDKILEWQGLNPDKVRKYKSDYRQKTIDNNRKV